ncbi:hypothetical protein GGR57DRAFT_453218 [Xylariaceae sp. FL1272]|nr:hypothetical protein GGR57DRAFT_453218 [Xylariaceae sp. FL1272]
MQLVSDSVRAYMNVSEEDDAPFGQAWDVLWLGHCGSVIHWNEIQPTPIIYGDDSRCGTAAYWGWAKRDIRKNIPEGHRIVQAAGSQTVCTFGYGVTKKSAPKLLDLLGGGGGEAYDVHLSTMCRKGKLRCIVVNPEVFHHYEPPASNGYQSLVDVGNGKGIAGDEHNFEFKKGVTGNIVKSARCEALFHNTCMKPPSDN